MNKRTKYKYIELLDKNMERIKHIYDAEMSVIKFPYFFIYKDGRSYHYKNELIGGYILEE